MQQMTRYKQADFADEDTSSIGSRSIHLNETTTIPSMHIRYHTAHVSLVVDLSSLSYDYKCYLECEYDNANALSCVYLIYKN